jgi:prevent-host-death family protein
MAITVNMREAKTRLSRLVVEVQAGKKVFITKSGKPVVQLTRIKENVKPRRLGAAKGMVRLTKGFDAPVQGLEEFYK